MTQQCGTLTISANILPGLRQQRIPTSCFPLQSQNRSIHTLLTGNPALTGCPRTQPHPSDSGILISPSTAFLRPQTTGHIKLTHKRSRTALRLRSISTKRAKSNACPLCPADTSSLIHQSGGCRHPKVHAIICLRHEYTVHQIALAIKQGAFGDAYLFMDAEVHQRFPRNTDNVPALLAWVCPLTHSKPNVVFFPSISTCISQDDLQTWGPAERSHHSAVLLEVSLTSDTNLHYRAVDKCEQRSHSDRLSSSLAGILSQCCLSLVGMAALCLPLSLLLSHSVG